VPIVVDKFNVDLLGAVYSSVSLVVIEDCFSFYFGGKVVLFPSVDLCPVFSESKVDGCQFGKLDLCYGSTGPWGSREFWEEATQVLT
jgi:hypothetical protein